MENVFEAYKEEDQRKAKVGTIIWIVLMLFILLYPIMRFQDPPPGQEGILVNLGTIDMGNFDDDATASSNENTESEATEATPEEVPEETEPTPEPEPEPEPQEEPKKEPAPAKEKEVVTNDAEQIALNKAKEKQKEADRKAKEKEAKEKAAKEAKERAEREKAEKARQEKERQQAEANNLKNELGGLFGNGSGQGNNNSGGNQGTDNGDPNSNVLEGISTGAGQVGGGLAGRGGEGPLIKDNSQATGVVVVKVCVDDKGKVIGTPEFTLAGSTTQNSRLKALAIENAKKWSFKTGVIDKQCGTITYDFKVK